MGTFAQHAARAQRRGPEREQLDVINYHPHVDTEQVREQTFEYDGFTFELTFLHTNTVWHVTGISWRPDGRADGSLINLVLPGFHTRARVVDLVEKIIVEHVNYRR